jgi:hypothetical protein
MTPEDMDAYYRSMKFGIEAILVCLILVLLAAVVFS